MKYFKVLDFQKLLLKSKGDLIALDIGTKNIGVAVTIRNQSQILPYGVIERIHPRTSNESLKDLSNKLQKIVKEQKIKGIIVGFPMTLDNEPTKLAHEIIKITEKLNINILKKRKLIENENQNENENNNIVKNEEIINDNLLSSSSSNSNSTSSSSSSFSIVSVPIPFTYWDERNSTSYARTLASSISNNKKKYKEENKDTYAAVIILYSFLNQIEENKNNNIF